MTDLLILPVFYFACNLMCISSLFNTWWTWKTAPTSRHLGLTRTSNGNDVESALPWHHVHHPIARRTSSRIRKEWDTVLQEVSCSCQNEVLGRRQWRLQKLSGAVSGRVIKGEFTKEVGQKSARIIIDSQWFVKHIGVSLFLSKTTFMRHCMSRDLNDFLDFQLRFFNRNEGNIISFVGDRVLRYTEHLYSGSQIIIMPHAWHDNFLCILSNFKDLISGSVFFGWRHLLHDLFFTLLQQSFVFVVFLQKWTAAIFSKNLFSRNKDWQFFILSFIHSFFFFEFLAQIIENWHQTNHRHQHENWTKTTSRTNIRLPTMRRTSSAIILIKIIRG